MSFEFTPSGFCLSVEFPIRIWGMDASGHPFTQQASTQTVGLEEVCISGLKSRVNLDEIVGVSYEGRKARFRVVAAEQHGGVQSGRIGVRTIDAGMNICGVEFTEESARVFADRRERRDVPRYRCDGAISIFQDGTQYAIHAAVSDVGLRGCYVELLNPMTAGTKITFTLGVLGISVRGSAHVSTSHPAVGMGLQFDEISDPDQELLRGLISRLAKDEPSR